MALDLKPGEVILFINDKKGNDARPDYRGEVELSDEVLMEVLSPLNLTTAQTEKIIAESKKRIEISLYDNESKSGVSYLKGRVQKVWQKPEGDASSDSKESEKVDDDLPF